jgi:membrane-bound ClpP family serine protease
MAATFDLTSSIGMILFVFIIFLASIYLIGLVYKPALFDAVPGTVITVNALVAAIILWFVIYVIYRVVKNKYPAQYCVQAYEQLQTACLKPATGFINGRRNSTSA